MIEMSPIIISLGTKTAKSYVFIEIWKCSFYKIESIGEFDEIKKIFESYREFGFT